MPGTAPRLPRRHRFLKIFLAIVGVGIAAFLILGIWVYRQSVSKFEVRRLSLPTRIYADYTPLKPGMLLAPDDLGEKLERLGYRQSDSLAQSGDFVPRRGEIDIYTRAFTHPSGNYSSQPIRITFRGGTIDSVVSLNGAGSANDVALEPELLTSILSDQLENRRPVSLDQVPKTLQDAVVEIEDIRFWHHPGVDPIGIFRAFFRNVKAGGVTEGGSTLTQQLVKNYYLTTAGQPVERTMKRKVVEAFMAVILDWKYSKKEILEAYLNAIYLGRNRSISILGVGEAARFYFGKPVAEINLAESAMLAGVIRRPNNYSPLHRPHPSLQRRKLVLSHMLKDRETDEIP